MLMKLPYNKTINIIRLLLYSARERIYETDGVGKNVNKSEKDRKCGINTENLLYFSAHFRHINIVRENAIQIKCAYEM